MLEVLVTVLYVFIAISDYQSLQAIYACIIIFYFLTQNGANIYKEKTKNVIYILILK